jgi:WS/DGAT/MGAT family acyltransferase
MERLRGIDAGFLYMETPAVHMHTIKAAVMDPDPGPGRHYTLEKAKRTLTDRLPLLPPLRRRVIGVPWHLHHPVWIEDPDFDLDRHLSWDSLPAPGGGRELDAAISQIASVPLDRDKPLWELSIFDGLEGGRVAFVAKIHHTLADGLAAAQMLANVMDPEPGTADTRIVAPWQPEALPSPARLIVDALRDHLVHLRRFPALAARTARNLVALARSQRDAAETLPRPLLDAPKTLLNGSLTARRRFVSRSLPLDTVRTLRAALGVSINDIFLGLVAGSLRAYLGRRGEPLARPLLAEVPMALDRPGEARRLSGNRVSNLFMSLCTDEPDPLRRLHKIHAAMATAKRNNEILGPEMYRDWSEYTPPAPFALAMRLYARTHLANRHPPAINVIVSSVPGPRQPLRLAGGSLHSIYSVGPLIEGIALNVTAWSYVDQLNVGVLACPDLVGEPEEIADGIGAALDQLVHTANATDPARHVG